MHINGDSRVVETTITVGVGPRTLAGALPGYNSFAGAERDDGTAIAVGDTFWGAQWAVDADGNATGDYEDGLYTYSAAGEVSLTTVLRSSNADAAVVWAAGTKYIAMTLLPRRTVQLNAELAMDLPIAPLEPADALTDRVKFFARKRAGRSKLELVGASGWQVSWQDNMARNKYALWMPPGNATTTPGVFGMAALTAVGTATARNVAATSLVTRSTRLGYVGTATAGQLAGHYQATAQYTLGVPGAVNLGGFEMIERFACSDAATVAGARQFVGMTSATNAPTNVEPSTLTNCMGVGHGAANTNLFIYWGGTAAQAPIDLGVNFPANTLSQDMYELTLFAPSNSNNTVHYRVHRLNTDHVAEGTLTGVAGTALPSNTTFLAYRAWRSNNATALAVGLDVASYSNEKDN